MEQYLENHGSKLPPCRITRLVSERYDARVAVRDLPHQSSGSRISLPISLSIVGLRFSYSNRTFRNSREPEFLPKSNGIKRETRVPSKLARLKCVL